MTNKPHFCIRQNQNAAATQLLTTGEDKVKATDVPEEVALHELEMFTLK